MTLFSGNLTLFLDKNEQVNEKYRRRGDEPGCRRRVNRARSCRWDNQQPEALFLETSGAPMNVKERLAIPRQKPRELDPEERINNFDEVCKGFDEKTALLEADRCLQCRRPRWRPSPARPG